MGAVQQAECALSDVALICHAIAECLADDSSFSTQHFIELLINTQHARQIHGSLARALHKHDSDVWDYLEGFRFLADRENVLREFNTMHEPSDQCPLNGCTPENPVDACNVNRL